MRMVPRFYGYSSTLVDSNGNVIGTSATGNRQGDPLSFLAFCCGFQGVLIALKEAFAVIVAEYKPAAMNFTLAYADDCFLLGDVECVERMIPEAMSIFERGTVLPHAFQNANSSVRMQDAMELSITPIQKGISSWDVQLEVLGSAEIRAKAFSQI